jgi:hypothetical protein
VKVTQKWLLGAGALVLVLTNAVALVGVAYNRASPPDTVLTLSERELGPELSWMWREGENSGLDLHLQLRGEAPPNPRLGNNELDTFSNFSAFGPLQWLDKDKLTALGFSVAMAPKETDSEKLYGRSLGRDVLLVLELDGPTRNRALQAAHERVTRLEQASLEQEGVTTSKDGSGIQRRLQTARESLASEEQDRSRLFIIDAGLDDASLRQKYPDRSHYAIVRGNIRPVFIGYGASGKLYGTVTAVRCDSIHVPLQFRAAIPIEPAHAGRVDAVYLPRLPGSKNKQPFTAQVAFGRRLEPWVASASAGKTP